MVLKKEKLLLESELERTMGKHIMLLANDTTYTYNLRREIIGALLSQGNKVSIVYEKLQYTEELESFGCSLINVFPQRHGKNPFQDINLLLKYLRLLNKIKPDAVIGYNIKPNIYGSIAASIKNIPFIANVTGLGTAVENPGILRFLTVNLYRLGLMKAKTVFFQNARNEALFTELGIAKGKHKMLPGSGVNLNDYQVVDFPQYDNNSDHFLFVGRVMRDKGIGELLDAAKKIKEKYPNTVFDIVGGMDEDYVKILEDYDKNGIINYHGQQSDVKPFYQNCSVVVLPTYHEGMANVLLEGAASGRPVIATKIPGCQEIFDDGITGFGLEPKNVDSLYEALERFIQLDYETKKQMGISGRAKVEKEFDRRIVIDKYLQELEDIGV